jgi:hypothetical protein
VSQRTHWSPELILDVLGRLERGEPRRAVAAATGVPEETIRNWQRGRLPVRARRAAAGATWCARCGREEHDFSTLPRQPFAYLLGLYLGDGCLYEHSRGTWVLRVTLDAAYPWIVISACDAIEDVRGRRPSVARHTRDRAVTVVSYWKPWACLFPQHGPGRKHDRRIELAAWQEEIVRAAPEPFLRGLIHSDGWRGMNRVKVKDRWYAYPRYQFSNRSDDIRTLFTDTCDMLGVQWRPWGRYHVSVARREAVARLDAFIGPKC